MILVLLGVLGVVALLLLTAGWEAAATRTASADKLNNISVAVPCDEFRRTPARPRFRFGGMPWSASVIPESEFRRTLSPFFLLLMLLPLEVVVVGVEEEADDAARAVLNSCSVSVQMVVVLLLLLVSANKSAKPS